MLVEDESVDSGWRQDPQACETGEQLCMRCGKTADAYIGELTRQQALTNCRTSTLHNENFEDTAKVLDMGPENNPFKPRGVTMQHICGLEVDIEVAVVEEEVFETEATISTVRAKINRATAYNPRGEPLVGIVCDPKDIPDRVPWHRGRMFYKQQAVLNETIMKPTDQQKEAHALNMWKYVCAQTDANRDKSIHYQAMAQMVPSWASLMEKARLAKEELKKNDTMASNAAAGMDATGTGPRGARTMLVGGGGVASSLGSLMQGAGTNKGPARGQPKAAPKATNRSTPVSGSSARGRGSRPAPLDANTGSVAFVGGRTADVQTGSEEGAPTGKYYRHKSIDIAECLQGKNIANVLEPVLASACTHSYSTSHQIYTPTLMCMLDCCGEALSLVPPPSQGLGPAKSHNHKKTRLTRPINPDPQTPYGPRGVYPRGLEQLG